MSTYYGKKWGEDREERAENMYEDEDKVIVIGKDEFNVDSQRIQNKIYHTILREGEKKCDCKDYEWRKDQEGYDGCKHMKLIIKCIEDNEEDNENFNVNNKDNINKNINKKRRITEENNNNNNINKKKKNTHTIHRKVKILTRNKIN